MDEYVQGRIRGYGSWANKSIWWIGELVPYLRELLAESVETILTAVTVYNIVEAYVSLQSPAPPPKPTATSGPQLTPARVSSPLVNLNHQFVHSLANPPDPRIPTPIL